MNTTIKAKALALLTSVCALTLVAGTPRAHAAQYDPNIKVVIESPTSDHAGVTVVRGFALAHTGIDRVTWSVDGKDMGTLPFGGSRGDVAEAYKQYPSKYAKNSGFATAWSMALFDEGTHTIEVTAYDKTGGMNSDTAEFRSYRFGDKDERFINQDEMIMQAFVMSGVKLYPGKADAPQYDIQFNWSKAAQAFVMTKVEKVCDTNCLMRVTSKPSKLKAQYSAANRGNLVEWLPNSALHVGYEVQRRLISGTGVLQQIGEWHTIGYRPAYDPTFVDDETVLTVAGDEFEYRVRAFSEQEMSDWTAAAGLSSGNGTIVFPGGNGGNGGNNNGGNGNNGPSLPWPNPQPAPNGNSGNNGLPPSHGGIVNPGFPPNNPLNP